MASIATRTSIENRRVTDRPLNASEPIVDEAAGWVARLRADDVSNDDRAAFATWLSRDRRHRREFDAMLEVWTLVGPVARGAAAPRTKRRRPFGVPIALAAAASIATLALWVEPWTERLRTAHGAVAAYVLADGTRLHLNTDSAVRVDFSDRTRRIELEHGEVFVEVAHEAGRPLTVDTRYGIATATGTAFAVRDAGGRALVTVTEGQVRVQSRDGATRSVGPGDQAELSASDIVTRAVDRSAAASWRDGALVYDGVRLADLIEDLNRYLPRRMTIADPQLAELRVSAVLVIADQEQMLEALSRSLPLRWTVVSDSLIILHAAA